MKNNKINLKDLTFCIPVRIDSPYRERNLVAALKFYARHIHCNYIIVEAAKEQHLKKLPSIEGLTYHFIYDDNPTFHTLLENNILILCTGVFHQSTDLLYYHK